VGFYSERGRKKEKRRRERERECVCVFTCVSGGARLICLEKSL
jgi:hypothetical protein